MVEALVAPLGIVSLLVIHVTRFGMAASYIQEKMHENPYHTVSEEHNIHNSVWFIEIAVISNGLQSSVFALYQSSELSYIGLTPICRGEWAPQKS